MTFSDFHDFHMPGLLADEVRHNLLIAILAHARTSQAPDLRTWTLGDAGRCAVQSPGRAIVLGALDRAQCHILADTVAAMDFPAVLGPDLTADWFVERSVGLGLAFKAPIPQRIYALDTPPVPLNVPGRARKAGIEDIDRFAEWLIAFHREAVPHDPVPSRAVCKAWLVEDLYLFWTVEDEPVSMAGIQRRTPNAAAIAGVYTPPDLRGRGYAGCATAAVVDRIRAEGRKTACLYTDLRNPASNRCYARIGFRPVCDSRFYLRQG